MPFGWYIGGIPFKIKKLKIGHMDKEAVFQELRRKIFQKELSPGQWLVERDISGTYKISRTPVREILRRLSVEGLVTLEPSKGYMVKQLNLEEIVEIFQAREAIEGMASRLACLRGGENFFSLVQQLKAQLEEIKINKQADCVLGVKIGRQLHEAIIEASNNSVIFEFYQKLKNLAALTRNITEKSIEIEAASKRSHIAIARTLLERNEIGSEKLMREHLNNTCRLLVESYLLDQAGL
jgi:DNA-binding GntR family transcriptional regulator